VNRCEQSGILWGLCSCVSIAFVWCGCGLCMYRSCFGLEVCGSGQCGQRVGTGEREWHFEWFRGFSNSV